MSEQQASVVPEKKREISKESAQAQLDLFLDFYQIDPLDIDDDSQRSAIKSTLNRIRKAIMTGRVEVLQDGDLEVKQHTKQTENKTVFTYKEITGKHKRQLDKIGDENYKRVHTILSSLSGIPVHEFSKLKGADMSISESLGALFLLA